MQLYHFRLKIGLHLVHCPTAPSSSFDWNYLYFLVRTKSSNMMQLTSSFSTTSWSWPQKTSRTRLLRVSMTTNCNCESTPVQSTAILYRFFFPLQVVVFLSFASSLLHKCMKCPSSVTLSIAHCGDFFRWLPTNACFLPPVSQTQLPQFTEAASILIRYIILHLDTTAPCKPSILLMALKVLCEGKRATENQPNATSSASSIISVSGMKYLKYPEIPGNKPGSVGAASSSTSGGSGASAGDKESPKAEMKRSRSDLSTVILQQLTTPLCSWAVTFAALSEEQIDCTVSMTNSKTLISS